MEALVYRLEEQPYIYEKLKEIGEQLVDPQCEQAVFQPVSTWEMSVRTSLSKDHVKQHVKCEVAAVIIAAEVDNFNTKHVVTV